MAISLPSAEYLDSNESLVLKVGEEVVKIYPLSLGPKLTHYGRITEQSAQQFNGLEVTLPINYRPSSFRLKIVPIQKVQSQPEEIEIQERAHV